MLHGNKNDISKSNIINNIPTKKNRTSNCFLLSVNGANPHSYVDTFSASGLLFANKYDNPTKITAITADIIVNIITVPYSNIFFSSFWGFYLPSVASSFSFFLFFLLIISLLGNKEGYGA